VCNVKFYQNLLLKTWVVFSIFFCLNLNSLPTNLPTLLKKLSDKQKATVNEFVKRPNKKSSQEKVLFLLKDISQKDFKLARMLANNLQKKLNANDQKTLSWNKELLSNLKIANLECENPFEHFKNLYNLWPELFFSTFPVLQEIATNSVPELAIEMAKTKPLELFEILDFYSKLQLDAFDSLDSKESKRIFLEEYSVILTNNLVVIYDYLVLNLAITTKEIKRPDLFWYMCNEILENILTHQWKKNESSRISEKLNNIFSLIINKLASEYKSENHPLKEKVFETILILEKDINKKYKTYFSSFENPKFIGLLIEKLNSPNTQIAIMAASTLNRYRKKLTPELISKLNYFVKQNRFTYHMIYLVSPKLLDLIDGKNIEYQNTLLKTRNKKGVVEFNISTQLRSKLFLSFVTDDPKIFLKSAKKIDGILFGEDDLNEKINVMTEIMLCFSLFFNHNNDLGRTSTNLIAFFREFRNYFNDTLSLLDDKNPKIKEAAIRIFAPIFNKNFKGESFFQMHSTELMKHDMFRAGFLKLAKIDSNKRTDDIENQLAKRKIKIEIVNFMTQNSNLSLRESTQFWLQTLIDSDLIFLKTVLEKLNQLATKDNVANRVHINRFMTEILSFEETPLLALGKKEKQVYTKSPIIDFLVLDDGLRKSLSNIAAVQELDKELEKNSKRLSSRKTKLHIKGGICINLLKN